MCSRIDIGIKRLGIAVGPSLSYTWYLVNVSQVKVRLKVNS